MHAIHSHFAVTLPLRAISVLRTLRGDSYLRKSLYFRLFRLVSA
jgi:hypothetical protein